MKRTLVLIAIFFFLISGQAFAQSKANVGFIQGNIWFSKNPFFAGDNVRIYSAILNSEDEDVLGTIEFFDNGEKIGSTQFQAAKGATLEQVWIDWQASEGEHNIYAKISKLSLSLPGGQTQEVTPASTKSGEVDIDLDIDTDGDGIGNKEDEDDDNDGLSDEEEESKGMDPLIADSDGDGLSDGEEIEKGSNPLDKDSDNDGIKDGDDDSPASIIQEPEVEKPANSQEKVAEIAKDKALEAKNLVDKFVEYEQEGLAKEKATTKRKLELIKGTAKPDSEEEQSYLSENQNKKNKGVFLRAYLILLSLLEALFKFKPVLYILLLLIALKILHWVFKALRRGRGSSGDIEE